MGFVMGGKDAHASFVLIITEFANPRFQSDFRKTSFKPIFL